MSEWKVWSFTTWKGCWFSETQCTNSALKGLFLGLRNRCICSNILCLQFGVCMQTVSDLTIPNPFKCHSDWSIQSSFLWQSLVCNLEVPCCIGGLDNFLPPANLCMSAQIACWASVAGVQEAPNISGLAEATRCCALEHMGLTTFVILDTGGGFEEDINRCIPPLQHAIYGHITKLTTHKKGNGWHTELRNVVLFFRLIFPSFILFLIQVALGAVGFQICTFGCSGMAVCITITTNILICRNW